MTMSSIMFDTARPGSHTLRAVSNLVTTLRRMRMERRTRRILEGLSDAQLDDIGMTRWDITRAH